MLDEFTGDRDEAAHLLELARSHLGVEDPSDLNQGDLEELLLDVYPRKVVVTTSDEAASVVSTVRDLLAFLRDTGRVPPARIRKLEHEVDEIEPRFLDAVMDPTKWGPARFLTQSMIESGVDLSDQDAVDDWITNYNASLVQLPPRDWARALGLPERLPPLRLPEESELAEAARRSRLLAQARELAVWIGNGRDLTEESGLTVADTVAAARALGIAFPEPVSDMGSVPALVHLFNLAETVEFIEVSDTHAKTAPEIDDWPEGADEDVLFVWDAAFGHVIANALAIDRDLLDDQDFDDFDFVSAGGALSMALFLARNEGMPLTDMGEIVREIATAALLPVPAQKRWAAWASRHGDPARALLDYLHELGAVEFDDESVRFTPLALWALRQQFVEGGVEIPLLPPVEQMTAADLIEAAGGFSSEELAAESAAWLALRSPEDAGRELLEVAAAGGATDRMYAVSLIRSFEADTEALWRSALDHPVMRPYAKVALGAEPVPEDLAWLLTDVLAATMDETDAEDLKEQFGQAVPSGQEQMIFDTMWRLPHPQVHDVLRMIGELHPDKKTAKAARKAAFKAASRQHS